MKLERGKGEGAAFSVLLIFLRYGVKEFVLVAPEKGSESLTSQAQAKLMLSSVSVAIANTQWYGRIWHAGH